MEYLRQDPITGVMAPVEGVQAGPAAGAGLPIETNHDGVIDPTLLPNNYDPNIPAVADEALQPGDVCYYLEVNGQRRIRKANSALKATLGSCFVKHAVAVNQPCSTYLQGLMALPNPGPAGPYLPSDVGKNLWLSQTIPGYVSLSPQNLVGQWTQHVATVVDVSDTEIKAFFVAPFDAGSLGGNQGTGSGSGTDAIFTAHLTDTANPHHTTAQQVGAIPETALGAPNGAASLGQDGLVPEQQLPATLWQRKPVRVVVQTNIDLNLPGPVLDNTTMLSGDMVLLIGQSQAALNGVWTWTGATAAMTRAAAADTAAELWSSLWFIREGSSAGQVFANMNPTIPTLGLTNLTFRAAVSGMANPMTNQDDVIVGGAGGNATRLPKPTASKYLGTNAQDAFGYHDLPGGLTNPMTTLGDVLVAGANGAPARLPIGSPSQYFGVSPQGALGYFDVPVPGMANPMTAQWDIIMAGPNGVPTRIARPGASRYWGTDGSGNLGYMSLPASLTNPMTAQGDIILGGVGGTPTRVSKPGANTYWGTDSQGNLGYQTGTLTGMTNPMSAQYDVIYGGPGGIPQRLAKAGNDQYLGTNSLGVFGYHPISAAGIQNPLQNAQDIFIGGTGGTPARLGVGPEGSTLTVFNGNLAWVSSPGGMLGNPMTAQDDLIVGDLGGNPLRLAKGVNNQVLGITGGHVAWVNIPAPGMSNPMLAQGDLIIGGTGGYPNRLPRGLSGQVLTMSGINLVWQDIPLVGMANVFTALYDMVVSDTNGNPVRMAVGGHLTYLGVDANGVLGYHPLPSSGMANPMTTVDDIIVAGAAGAPTRVGKPGVSHYWGTDGTGNLGYMALPSPGMFNPMTMAADLIVGGASGIPNRLLKGVDGQVLTMVTGGVAWASLPDPGMFNPMTTQGDLLFGAGGGLPTRLPKGIAGMVLYAGDSPYWDYPVDPTKQAIVMTQPGDIVVGGAGGTPTRVAKPLADFFWGTDNAGNLGYQPVVSGFQNPMTGLGDLLVGGNAGVGTRLPIGATGQLLGIVGGIPAWTNGNALVAQYDLYVGGVGGAADRLAKGANGQVLSMVSGALAWADPNMVNPMTLPEDIIIGGVAGVPNRLGLGALGQILTVVDLGVAGHGVRWANAPGGMTNPMTAAQDLIVGGASGVPARLVKGVNGQVLSITGGVVGWVDAGTFGLTNPMTTPDDLIIGGVLGAPARLAKGTTGQVLTMTVGGVAWADATGGGGGPVAATDPALQSMIAYCNGTNHPYNVYLPGWTPKAVGNVLRVTAHAQVTHTANTLQLIRTDKNWVETVVQQFVGVTTADFDYTETATSADTLSFSLRCDNHSGLAEFSAPTKILAEEFSRSEAPVVLDPYAAMNSPKVIPLVEKIAFSNAATDLAHPVQVTITPVNTTDTFRVEVTGFVLGDGAGSTVGVQVTKDNQGMSPLISYYLHADTTNPTPFPKLIAEFQTGDLLPFTIEVNPINGASWVAGNHPNTNDPRTQLTVQVLDYISPKTLGASAGPSFTNPMTTPGDFIVGGAAGAPQRLAKGFDGQILKMVAGVPTYVNPDGAALVNPMTAAGDFITGGALGTPERLPIGLEGQILGVSGGHLAYVSPTGVSPASATQTDGGYTTTMNVSDNLGAWLGGTSYNQQIITPGRAGDVIKLCLGAADPTYGIGLANVVEAPSIFAADGTTTGTFTINLKVNGVVVASQTVDITDATLPANYLVDQPLIYKNPGGPITYELRAPDTNPLNVEWEIAEAVANNVVFWAEQPGSGLPFPLGYGYPVSDVLVYEQWDFTYKLSGIGITVPPGDQYGIFIQVPVPDSDWAFWPSLTYTNSGGAETSPAWVGNPNANMMTGLWSELGHPESWHQASVPFFVGARYKWTAKGIYVAPNGQRRIMNEAGNLIHYVATRYSNIDLECEITLPSGEVHTVQKHIVVDHQEDYNPHGGQVPASLFDFTAYLPHGVAGGSSSIETIFGVKDGTTSTKLWRALSNTGFNPEELVAGPSFSMDTTGKADPRIHPLSNGNFVVSAVTNGGYRNWSYCQPDGNVLFGDGGGQVLGVGNWDIAFADDGSYVAVDLTPSADQTIKAGVGPVAPTTWTMPGGVRLVALAIDAANIDALGGRVMQFYGFTSDYQLVKVSLNSNNTVDLFFNWYCTPSTDPSFVHEVMEPTTYYQPCNLYIPHARMAFRSNETTQPGVKSWIYLWGDNDVLVRACATDGSPIPAVAISRKGLTNVIVPYWTRAIYARAELRDISYEKAGNIAQFGPTEVAAYKNAGRILEFTSSQDVGFGWAVDEYDRPFDPTIYPSGITETSPLVVRNGALSRVMVFTEKGKPGDELEVSLTVPTTHSLTDFEFWPVPSAGFDTTVRALKHKPGYTMFTYRAKFEGDTLQWRAYSPTFMVDMKPEVKVIETIDWVIDAPTSIVVGDCILNPQTPNGPTLDPGGYRPVDLWNVGANAYYISEPWFTAKVPYVDGAIYNWGLKHGTTQLVNSSLPANPGMLWDYVGDTLYARGIGTTPNVMNFGVHAWASPVITCDVTLPDGTVQELRHVVQVCKDTIGFEDAYGVYAAPAVSQSWPLQVDGNAHTTAVFRLPQRMRMTSKGVTYIQDGGAIRKIEKDANGVPQVTTLVGTNDAAWNYTDGPLGVGTVGAIYDFCIDEANNKLYMTSDRNTLRMLDLTTLELSTVAGSFNVNSYQDGSALTTAQFSYLSGCCMGFGSEVFVVDTGNSVIRSYDPITNTVSTILGTPHVTTNSLTSFESPQTVAFDHVDHILYVGTPYLITQSISNDGPFGDITPLAGSVSQNGTAPMPDCLDTTNTAGTYDSIVLGNINDIELSADRKDLYVYSAGPSIRKLRVDGSLPSYRAMKTLTVFPWLPDSSVWNPVWAVRDKLALNEEFLFWITDSDTKIRRWGVPYRYHVPVGGKAFKAGGAFTNIVISEWTPNVQFDHRWSPAELWRMEQVFTEVRDIKQQELLVTSQMGYLTHLRGGKGRWMDFGGPFEDSGDNTFLEKQPHTGTQPHAFEVFTVYSDNQMALMNPLGGATDTKNVLVVATGLNQEVFGRIEVSSSVGKAEIMATSGADIYYNPDGTLDWVQEYLPHSWVKTRYTYNGDGTVATKTLLEENGAFTRFMYYYVIGGDGVKRLDYTEVYDPYNSGPYDPNPTNV